MNRVLPPMGVAETIIACRRINITDDLVRVVIPSVLGKRYGLDPGESFTTAISLDDVNRDSEAGQITTGKVTIGRLLRPDCSVPIQRTHGLFARTTRSVELGDGSVTDRVFRSDRFASDPDTGLVVHLDQQLPSAPEQSWVALGNPRTYYGIDDEILLPATTDNGRKLLPASGSCLPVNRLIPDDLVVTANNLPKPVARLTQKLSQAALTTWIELQGDSGPSHYLRANQQLQVAG